AVVSDAPSLEEFQMIGALSRVRRIPLERVKQVFLIRAKILDPAFLHERNQLRGDRSLAWPEASRRLSKHLGMLLHGKRKLRRGILGPMIAFWETPSRQAPLRERAIEYQRKD